MSQSKAPRADYFRNMGKPIPPHALTAALEAVRDMAPEWSTEEAMQIVGRTADALQRDQPYEAMAAATNSKSTHPTLNAHSSGGAKPHPIPGNGLDLTGATRLVATLLAW